MIYLRNYNQSLPNAENFTYKEFIKSDVAVRKGIVNNPNEEQWQNIEKLAANVLQPVRNKFGRLTITSGFRSIPLCEAIGSTATSNHAKGQAADIEAYDYKIKLIDILTFIHDNLEYRELIAEFFPLGWVHVAYREGANAKILKLKDKNHHYKRVNLNYIKSLYK